MNDQEPVQFDRKSAKRIQAAVRQVESMASGALRPMQPGAYTYGKVRAKCSVEITEGDFDDLGEGKAKIWHHDSVDGWYEGEEVDVYNQYPGGPIAVGSALFLCWISGFWFVDTAPCPAEE